MLNKSINYILIVLGAVVAMYANSEEKQNQYILIGGIVILMIGIYRISRNIPSKHQENEDVNIKKDENDL